MMGYKKHCSHWEKHKTEEKSKSLEVGYSKESECNRPKLSVSKAIIIHNMSIITRKIPNSLIKDDRET